MKTPTEQEAIDTTLGESLAGLLDLKPDRDRLYNTSWGTKTALGLALTIRRMIKEHDAEEGKGGK